MNELYLTQDGKIAKYVHVDGSETAIKTLPKDDISCSGINRNKWNVFASCSVGCQIGCKFCFLTVKKFPFQKLSVDQISINVISAITEELKRRPELKDIPMNLSWMGMGDPWLDMNSIFRATKNIIENTKFLVKEIEGVDIASTFYNNSNTEQTISNLNSLDRLKEYVNNLSNLTSKEDINRTNVRLFYSLHSVDLESRLSIIPTNIYPFSFFDQLSVFHDVIFHCIFLDGINDSYYQIEKLIHIMKQRRNVQLRILRYNKCPNSPYRESKNFDNIIKYLYSELGDKLKVQESPGSEISAACGMFLMNKQTK